MEDKEKMVESLGFPKLKPVASFNSIAHLFGPSKKRCGIYLLEFPSAVFYIGQAVEVVRRFGQHRKNHNNIIGFAFIEIPRERLDDEEKKLIFDAENLGFVLSNTVHATTVVGDTDLDLIFDQEEQASWLKDPENTNAADTSDVIEFSESIIQRTSHKFVKFTKREHSELVIGALRTYINCCIPVPKRTEFSFWAMSCMPATDGKKLPRYCAISMGVMEVLVVGHTKQSDGELWGIVNVASDVLFPPGKIWEKLKFRAAHPLLSMKNCNYRDAGQHQLTLQAKSARELYKLINDKRVQNAAAQLNLRLMRKRATIYSKYHCVDLARECFKHQKR